MTNPLVSSDYSNLGTSDGVRHHYTGRVYAPTVTFDPLGGSATLVFSGYNTPQPLPSTKKSFGLPTANYAPTASQPADYRTIMRVTLNRTGAPFPGALSFDTLCSLGRSYSTNAVIADALCLRLDAARRTAAVGTFPGVTIAVRAQFNAYKLLVNSQVGRAFTADQAATLARFADRLSSTTA